GTGLLILILMVTQRFFSPEKSLTPERREVIQDIARLMMWFIVVDGILMVINFIILYYGNAAGFAAAEMFLHGSHRAMFLGVEIGIGLVLPFLLTFRANLRRSLPLVTIASISTLLGVLAMRINFVIGGQEIPLSGNTLNPYHLEPKHLTFLLLFAFIEIVILGLAFKLLPVYGLGEEEQESKVGYLSKGEGVSAR
ncbi:MAG: polysulfide reductase NrfD, partial [Desulfitobacterium sp.]|nr:polysulfide reductase NrfD [Desulfitobacterium sp.]